MRPSPALAMVLLAAAGSAAAATFTVECAQGCLPRGNEATPGVLFRADESGGITLRWRTAEDPAPRQETIRLYAGNPAHQDAIPDRGPLAFAHANGAWQATHSLAAAELGSGTLLTILVRQRDGEEAILDWRPHRLLTSAERERREAEPAPSGAWSIDVRPTALQVASGRGELPRSPGGEGLVWWSLAEAGTDTSDLDADGEHNGVPGLGVQVSSAWHAAAGQDWKAAVLERLGGVRGHEVHFEDLHWIERPDRALELGEDSARVFLRHYYTIVTLHTAASIRTFDAKDVGGGGLLSDPTYFSHETSARLKHTRDARFWASYSSREYGADRRLLRLLEKQSRNGIAGLGNVQTDDGDGGSAVYRVGWTARVRPWDEPGAGARRRAGFVGVDVVAARRGYGSVVTQGSAADTALERALCQVVRCGQEGGALDLDKPPAGYDVAQPSASLGTLPGTVTLLEGKPRFVQRGVPNLPELTRFALAAHLRAGALIRKGHWGHARNVVPIDSYAQFVLKLTVTMPPDAAVVTSDDPILPRAKDLVIATPLPRPGGFIQWIKERLAGFASLAILVVVLLLVLFVPGLRRFLSALFGRLTGRSRP